MRDIIDHYAAQGYRALDLGIGSDDYKRLFCKDDEPIFDSFIPLSQRGKLAAGVDVRPQPRQAAGEAQSGAARDGAEAAQRVQLDRSNAGLQGGQRRDSAVPTIYAVIRMVGTLRFAHPTNR